MTRVRRLPADTWQTLAVFGGGVAGGRWMAEDAFGYALLATVIGPIAVGTALSGSRHRVMMLFLLIGLTALPFWIDERPGMAGRLTVLISVWTGLLVAVSDALRGVLPSIGAMTVITLGWLTWVIGPLTRADAWGRAWVLAVNPVLAVNATSERAGDWTHQAVAYRWLTVLGQDVFFDEAVPALSVAVIYSGVAAMIWGITVYGRRMFHVEHSPSS